MIAIVLNVTGRYLAFHFQLPAYLNLCGTILTAYLEGPVVGVITAAISCAFSTIFCFTDWFYLIADIAVAIAAWLISKHNKFFEKFYLIISPTAFFAVVKTPVLLVINLSIHGGKSGLYFADAITDYLVSFSYPAWLGFLTTALFISFADSFAAVFLLYFAMLIGKSFGKRRRAAELKKELQKKVTFGILLAFLLAQEAISGENGLGEEAAEQTNVSDLLAGMQQQ